MYKFAGGWSKFQRKEGWLFGKIYNIQVTFTFFFKYIPVLVFCFMLLRKHLTAVGCTPRLHMPLRQLGGDQGGDELVKTTLPRTVNLSTHESETQTM